VLKAAVRPGVARKIDLVAGRRSGGTDVVASDALGRQFVFRIVVIRAESLSRKWKPPKTVSNMNGIR
jgi:hypothetical protein